MISNDGDVREFIDGLASPLRKRDATTLLEIMGRVTRQPPRMWGPTIIGFGEYHYEYATGREGDACAAGFSPRKAATTIYLPEGTHAHADALKSLGEHTTSVGCLYLKNLERVDLAVLESIIARSYAAVTTSSMRDPHNS